MKAFRKSADFGGNLPKLGGIGIFTVMAKQPVSLG
jgi:hypothetical protein